MGWCEGYVWKLRKGPQSRKSIFPPSPNNRQLAEALLTLVNTVEVGFEQVDQRFDGVDQRLDAMDKRFDGVDQRLDAMDKRFDGVDRKLDRMWGEINNQRGARFEELARKTLSAWMQNYSWTHGLEPPHITNLWSDRLLDMDSSAQLWMQLARELGIEPQTSALQRCDLLLRAVWTDGSTLLVTGEVSTSMSGRRQRKVAAQYEALAAAGHAVLPVLFGLNYRTSVEVPDLVDVHMTEEDLTDRWLPEPPASLHTHLDRLRGIPA